MTLLPKRFELPNDISYAPLVRHIDLSTFLQDLPVEVNKDDWSHATKSDNAPVEEFKVGDSVRLKKWQKDGQQFGEFALTRIFKIRKIEGEMAYFAGFEDSLGWYTWRLRHA